VKKFFIKFVLCLILCVTLSWTVNYFVYTGEVPMAIADRAVDQVKAGQENEAFLATRRSESATAIIPIISVGIGWVIIVVLFFGKDIKNLLMKGKNVMKNYVLMLMFIILAGSFVGCKQYKEEKFKEIQPNETAFVIKLEGENKQAKFDSIEYLKDRKVAAKRIEIPRRWKSTGYMYWSGEYIDLIKVITIDRTPVTVEWTAEKESGTANKDQGIWAESDDSVGFSTGFACSAYVSEDDSPTFLYYYPEKSLQYVMDKEVRTAFQGVVAEVSARYKMDTLRNRKQEIIDSVRYGIKEVEIMEIVKETNEKGEEIEKEVVKVLNAPSKEVDENGDELYNPSREGVIRFFKRRGLTITTTSMFGGFKYENPDVQKSIDATFIAQQEKVVNAARLEAQNDANERLVSEVTAQAKAVKEKAIGDANAVKERAAGEADAIKKIADAAKEAQQNPLFLELKRLEAFTAWLEKWNGNVPNFLVGSGGTMPPILLTMPSSETVQK